MRTQPRSRSSRSNKALNTMFHDIATVVIIKASTPICAVSWLSSQLAISISSMTAHNS